MRDRAETNTKIAQ